MGGCPPPQLFGLNTPLLSLVYYFWLFPRFRTSANEPSIMFIYLQQSVPSKSMFLTNLCSYLLSIYDFRRNTSSSRSKWAFRRIFTNKSWYETSICCYLLFILRNIAIATKRPFVYATKRPIVWRRTGMATKRPGFSISL